MRFRPCIDIHNGSVKQIVGASLAEADGVSSAKNNFVSSESAKRYAGMYKKHDLVGGHVIMLNAPGDEKYQETLEQAKEALVEFPNGLQIGGGITADNAEDFLKMGASHVIVTSYVFRDGKVDMERLKALESKVGADKIVLDLSVKRVGENYHVVTDRWQVTSEEPIHIDLFEKLSPYCCEYLVHAVDIEGKRGGIDEDLVMRLGRWDGHVITYAGGIKDIKDIQKIRDLADGRLDFTIGSALDIFGGRIRFGDVCRIV